MKLQFKLMALTLMVFASKVQAVYVPAMDYKGAFNAARASLTKANVAKVAVPVVGLTAIYKLNKAGKFETAKAKAKSALKNVSSWMNNNRKKTVVAVVGVGLAIYNRKAVKALLFRNKLRNKKGFKLS